MYVKWLTLSMSSNPASFIEICQHLFEVAQNASTYIEILKIHRGALEWHQGCYGSGWKPCCPCRGSMWSVGVNIFHYSDFRSTTLGVLAIKAFSTVDGDILPPIPSPEFRCQALDKPKAGFVPGQEDAGATGHFHPQRPSSKGSVADVSWLFVLLIILKSLPWE